MTLNVYFFAAFLGVLAFLGLAAFFAAGFLAFLGFSAFSAFLYLPEAPLRLTNFFAVTPFFKARRTRLATFFSSLPTLYLAITTLMMAFLDEPFFSLSSLMAA